MLNWHGSFEEGSNMQMYDRLMLVDLALGFVILLKTTYQKNLFYTSKPILLEY